MVNKVMITMIVLISPKRIRKELPVTINSSFH